MLVPDRGEPTTKIGLLISSCIQRFLGAAPSFSISDRFSPVTGFRRIQKLPPAHDGKLRKAVLRSS
jgi:hypothetical protein